VADAQAVFGGGGNSFRLLRTLTTLGVLEPLRQAAQAGVPYLAASAGGNLAGPAIRTTNDMPIVEPGSLAALGLIPFQLNPHYLDPVPGLREGAWLQVSGTRAHLSGRNTGRLFRRHTDPIDIPAGADLSDLLNTRPRFDIGTTAWAGSRRCPGRRCGPSLAGPGLVRQRSADPCSTRHLVRDSL